jgi:hypothetical protein
VIRAAVEGTGADGFHMNLSVEEEGLWKPERAVGYKGFVHFILLTLAQFFFFHSASHLEIFPYLCTDGCFLIPAYLIFQGRLSHYLKTFASSHRVPRITLYLR